MEDREIIDDFISSTPKWVEQMKKMGANKLCPICGLVPEKIEKLAAAVKRLRDKQNV